MHHRKIPLTLYFGPLLLIADAGFAQTSPTPPTLTHNQKATQAYLQQVCTQLEGNPATGQQELTPGQQDLLSQCGFLLNGDASPTAIANGLSAVSGQQINALGPQTKKFGSLQQDNLTARLAEVRRGATGVSLAGLSLTSPDGTVLAAGNAKIRDFLPVGASGDDDGAYLDGRLGIFANGSIQIGSKAQSKNSFAFNIKDDSVTIGADYRIGTQFVVGAAFGSGKTTTDFANSLGRLDLTARGLSVYASLYGANYYVDALAGYGVPTLDSTRNIAYAGPPAVDQTATGETRLHDLWTGISVGRPFDWGAFDVTPEGSLNYHEVRLDSFSETMSNPNGPGSGLGLTYGDASIPSLQGRAGLRTAYTWSTSWGVFAPNVHAAFIREFRNYPDTFTVKFENAPAGSTLGSVLQTDPPEGHYTGYGAGLSFQLAHSISGFFDYEELRTLKTIQSHEFSFGIRYQVGL